MTIITNDMRGQITNAVLKHGFRDKLTAFLERERALAEEVYALIYPTTIKNAILLLADAYPGSMHTRGDLIVNVAGMKLVIGRGTRRDTRSEEMQYLLPTDVEKPMFLMVRGAHEYAEPMAVFDADDALGKRIADYAMERQKLNEEIGTKRAEVAGVLKDIRSDGQLRDRWPAVLPLVGDIVKAPTKPQLPMVPVADLNASLGLPPLDLAA